MILTTAKVFKHHSQAFHPLLNPDSKNIRFSFDDTIVPNYKIEFVDIYPVEISYNYNDQA